MSAERVEMVSRREAAVIAHVHPNSIKNWEAAGRLTAVKSDDGMVMYARSELEAIVAQRDASALDDHARLLLAERELDMVKAENARLREEYKALLAEVIRIAGGRE